MTPRTRKQQGLIEPGIRRITLPISGETRFRVQLGGRGRGMRRSKLCKIYHEATTLEPARSMRSTYFACMRRIFSVAASRARQSECLSILARGFTAASKSRDILRSRTLSCSRWSWAKSV